MNLRLEPLLVMVLLLVGCGNEVASCDQVVAHTGEALIDALASEAVRTAEADGHDPDAPISFETLNELPDDVDVEQLPTEPRRPRPPVPDDADPWDLLVLLGPAEEAAELQAEADRLRDQATALDCGRQGWADDPVAEVLRNTHRQVMQAAEEEQLTYADFFLIYALAGAHGHLVDRPIHER